jgi:hypothetical protein
VRNVEHIRETGWPLRDDPLSVTGHARITNPAFAYLLAIVSFATPLAYKLLPNLFMVLLLIPVYFLTRRITKSSIAAIVAVILAGTGPIMFASHLATPNAAPLALFLILTILAMLYDIEKHLFALIFCAIALAFLHPLIFVLVIALFIMIVLLRVEGFGIDDRINELFFFTLLLAVWFYVLVYKKALFAFGIKTLWQNLPAEYFSASFGNATLLAVLYGLGIVTFLFGALGIYQALFESRERLSYAIVAPIIAITLLLAFRLIPLSSGIMALTPLLSIMAAYGIMTSGEYLRHTKTPWIVYPLAVILIIFFMFSAVVPALVNAHRELQNAPTQEEASAYRMLGSLLPDGAVMVTTVHEAGAVQYFSHHATVTDDDFLLVHNSNEFANDIDAVYTGRFAVNIVSKVEKLHGTHVLFSNDAAAQYARDRLLIDENACISSIPIDESTRLYTINCQGSVA